MLVPPGLLALVGAEQPRSCFGGIGQFRTAVFAARLTWDAVGGNSDPAAVGLDGIGRDAEGIGYFCIGSLLLTHCYNLFFL